MAEELNMSNLRPAKGAKKTKQRVGRGWGSNRGKYSGRGMKGQRARSGGKSGLKLKGLRAIMLNIPKTRGFKSPHAKKAVVNVADLGKGFKDGATVNPAALKNKGLVKDTKDGVKVLGNGEIKIKLTVKGCQVSASAREKIEASGGSVVA